MFAAVMTLDITRLPKVASSRACPFFVTAVITPKTKQPASRKDPTWSMFRAFGTKSNNRAGGRPANSESPYRPFEMLRCRFSRGDSYTWVYRRKNKDAAVITSWERYTVAQVDYPHLGMEMASKFDLQEPFETHHRMIINMEQHLQAASSEKDWSLVSFEYKDHTKNISEGDHSSHWHKLGHGQNVQAFEEKFNLFLMPHANVTGGHVQEPTVITQQPITIYNSSSLSMISATITRPLRHLYAQSWYACQPDELAGIAIWKDFGEYTFSLVERERNGVTQVFNLQPESLPISDHGS
jgi:hypothetical protein